MSRISPSHDIAHRYICLSLRTLGTLRETMLLILFLLVYEFPNVKNKDLAFLDLSQKAELCRTASILDLRDY